MVPYVLIGEYGANQLQISASLVSLSLRISFNRVKIFRKHEFILCLVLIMFASWLV